VSVIKQQRHWLYLLTALLLFMQSFALWHDVTHPFHIADTPCQQFEVISHTPSVEPSLSILPIFISQFSAVEPTTSVAYLPKRLRDSHGIRAPPFIS